MQESPANRPPTANGRTATASTDSEVIAAHRPETFAPPDLAVLGRFLELADPLTQIAIRIAVTVGVPETIRSGTDSIEGLAAALELDPAGLASLVGHLSERGLTSIDDTGRLTLTDIGRLMLDPDARLHLNLHGASAAMDASWAGLLDALETGAEGYSRVHGVGFW